MGCFSKPGAAQRPVLRAVAAEPLECSSVRPPALHRPGMAMAGHWLASLGIHGRARPSMVGMQHFQWHLWSSTFRPMPTPCQWQTTARCACMTAASRAVVPTDIAVPALQPLQSCAHTWCPLGIHAGAVEGRGHIPPPPSAPISPSAGIHVGAVGGRGHNPPPPSAPASASAVIHVGAVGVRGHSPPPPAAPGPLHTLAAVAGRSSTSSKHTSTRTPQCALCPRNSQRVKAGPHELACLDVALVAPVDGVREMPLRALAPGGSAHLAPAHGCLPAGLSGCRPPGCFLWQLVLTPTPAIPWIPKALSIPAPMACKQSAECPSKCNTSASASTELHRPASPVTAGHGTSAGSVATAAVVSCRLFAPAQCRPRGCLPYKQMACTPASHVACIRVCWRRSACPPTLPHPNSGAGSLQGVSWAALIVAVAWSGRCRWCCGLPSAVTGISGAAA